jgi:putative flippase GtrA
MKVDHLTNAAIKHTLHCLTGCAIGEVTGVAIGTALGWHAAPTIALAIALAFLFGYLLTFRSVYPHSPSLNAAIKITLATDTVSITSMEIIDNAVLLAIPGAMESSLDSWFFWGSLAFALAVAFVVTVPVNRFMIARSGHDHHH